MKYNFQKIEKKWQKVWAEKNFSVWSAERGGTGSKSGRKQAKKYILDMFPYPSGSGLHVGHLVGYIGSDIVSRYFRMKGLSVLHPMGWDAFGLPAENFAIKHKIHPSVAVKKNIANFKKELNRVGFSYDWQREINTTDPAYYKWTQWIFIQLFKKGLAYKAKMPVNWCPCDKTVLANEEVIDGKCERCGSVVERRELEQWVLKITAYADRLLRDLEKLDWPNKVKEMQKNWIGRSEGAEIEFQIPDSRFKIQVFTTRPDTLFGATYTVLAPEHPLILQLQPQIKNWDEVQKYIKAAKNKSDVERQENKEKTGVELKGVVAVNPANSEALPVWVADYVLASVGTGAIMAVPAHDQRDFEFATKHHLPIKIVICPNYPEKICPILTEAYVGEGHLVASGKFDGMKSEDAKSAITKFVGGMPAVKYKLRDWIFSRQRYWGEPIPIVYCEQCGARDANTKLTIDFYGEHQWDAIISGKKTIETRALYLPERKKIRVGDLIRLENQTTHQIKIAKVIEVNIFKNLSELFKRRDLIREILPDEKIGDLKHLEAKYESLDKGYVAKINKYGIAAWRIELVDTEKIIPVPEKDLPITLPKVKSYEPTGKAESPLAAIEKWVSAKCPECGGPARRETNTMPQWAGSCWYYLRYVDPHNQKKLIDAAEEKKWMPVDVYVGGVEHAVLHLLYARFWHKFLFDIGAVTQDEPFQKLVNQGLMLGPDGQKMSKSRGNVVGPDEMIKKFGADALRMYEMFMSPFGEYKPWQAQGIVGISRFLNRLWNFVLTARDAHAKKTSAPVEKLLHCTIKKVSEDIEQFHFNTAISAMMSFLNEAEDERINISAGDIERLLRILFPFAPHIAQELWSMLGSKNLLDYESWPAWNPALVQNETFDLVVQINGKMRVTLSLPVGASQQEAEQAARANEAVAKHLQGKTAKKIVFVQNRLINFVF